MVNTWSKRNFFGPTDSGPHIYRDRNIGMSHAVGSEQGRTVLLVHGASHQGASWRTLQTELTALGIDSVTVDLPSASPDLADLYADAAVIRSAVDALGPVTVVCHSYGGMPTTQALVGATNVERIVYLTAYMPAPGMTLIDLVENDEDDTDWTIDNDETTIRAVDPRALFYNRCSQQVADDALQDLSPHALVSFTQPATVAAWQSVPSSYIVCTDDHAIPASAQRRMAAQADETFTIDSDHSPFLSAPVETAALLAGLIDRQRV